MCVPLFRHQRLRPRHTSEKFTRSRTTARWEASYRSCSFGGAQYGIGQATLPECA